MARLREAIELADYDDDASARVTTCLDDATATTASSIAAFECLRNLAFIICTEPELLRAPLFVPYLDLLLSTVAIRLGVCDEEDILTLGTFGFHLLVRSDQKGMGFRETAGKALWDGLLTRTTLSIPTIGKILTSVVAEAQAEQPVELETCRTWTNELLGAFRAHAADGGNLTSAFGRLLAREARNDLQGRLTAATATVDTAPGDTLYGLACSTASKFWWHAAEHVLSQIDILREETRRSEELDNNLIAGPVYTLVGWFDDLRELQGRFCDAEAQSQSQTGQPLGVTHRLCS